MSERAVYEEAHRQAPRSGGDAEASDRVRAHREGYTSGTAPRSLESLRLVEGHGESGSSGFEPSWWPRCPFAGDTDGPPIDPQDDDGAGSRCLETVCEPIVEWWRLRWGWGQLEAHVGWRRWNLGCWPDGRQKTLGTQTPTQSPRPFEIRETRVVSGRHEHPLLV